VRVNLVRCFAALLGLTTVSTAWAEFGQNSQGQYVPPKKWSNFQAAPTAEPAPTLVPIPTTPLASRPSDTRGQATSRSTTDRIAVVRHRLRRDRWQRMRSTRLQAQSHCWYDLSAEGTERRLKRFLHLPANRSTQRPNIIQHQSLTAQRMVTAYTTLRPQPHHHLPMHTRQKHHGMTADCRQALAAHPISHVLPNDCRSAHGSVVVTFSCGVWPTTNIDAS
jgi:hypothetical protein